MRRAVSGPAARLIGCCAAAIPAAAQDAPAPAPAAAPPTAPAEPTFPKWSDSAELGWVATSGNSESSSLGLKNTLKREGEHDLFELKLGGIKVTTSDIRLFAVGSPGDFSREEDKDSKTTAENYFLTGRYDHNITERLFWFGGAGWDRNVPAGIQNRYVVFGGVGHNWFKTDRRTWRTDYSATGTKQDNVVDDPTFDDTFIGVRLMSTFLQKFGTGDSGSYGNDTIIDENLNETTDWRVDMTNWVSLNMNDHLALKVSLQWLYDNLPSLKEVNLYPPTDPGGTGTPIGTAFVEVDDLDSIFTTALVIKY
jgi:putative salt-induced outer membrane protein YdiY